MFRSKQILVDDAVIRAVLAALLTCASGLADDVGTSRVDLGLVLALRYNSGAEVAHLQAPTFSLLSPFIPPEQRTAFRCVHVGSFEDWERNRKPWKTRLNLHYYNAAKQFVSISDYPTDPRPEEFELSSVDDIRFIRTLIADQFADHAVTSTEGAPRDLQQMASLLGVGLLTKLLPRLSVSDATVATALKNAFWQERSQIVAGAKLARSITLLVTADDRRFVRILTVVQVRESFLPLETCYYPTPIGDRRFKYSEGLPVPAGGLDFVPSMVGAPLYVYLLDGGPSSADVAKTINAAAAIWEKAGIILTPKLEVLDKNRTVALLGKDESIGYYLSCEGRFASQGDLEARIRLSKLKPDARALAVFFGKARATQSEPELLQAYIGNDPNVGVPGLTVAHEIGHLFFGSGHVGGETRGPCVDPTYHDVTKQPVAFTSRLMESPQSAGDITYQDAILAKKKIVTLPEARWW